LLRRAVPSRRSAKIICEIEVC